MCSKYNNGHCEKGARCAFRHIKPEKDATKENDNKVTDEIEINRERETKNENFPEDLRAVDQISQNALTQFIQSEVFIKALEGVVGKMFKDKEEKQEEKEKKSHSFKIMYVNCRGIKGKKDSFKEIVEKLNPDIIVLNETMYRNNERTNIRSYKPYTHNRVGKNGGGIEILVRENIENKTLKISEGSSEIEELTIRTETKNRIINIISLYGKIEGRESKENIKKQFAHIEQLIKRIESSGEDYILVGDLNAKIGCKEDGIDGNNEGQNEAGKALLNLEQISQGLIVNKTQKCKGKWTRVNTKNDNEKAILDYVMTNQSVYDDIIEMKIDEENLYRLTKYKGKEVIETDHNTIIIEINDTRQIQKKDKKIKWNTKYTEGWEIYKEATENNRELDRSWRSDNIEKEWENLIEIVNKILNESLGKIRITDKNRQGIDDEVREMMQEKRKIRKETHNTENLENKNILIKRRKEVEAKIKKKINENEEEKILEMTKSLSDKKNNNKELWKIKRRTQTKQSSAFVLKDNEGNDIVNPEEIKKRVTVL